MASEQRNRDRAIELNNEGIRSIDRGDLGHALRMFRACLTETNSTMTNPRKAGPSLVSRPPQDCRCKKVSHHVVTHPVGDAGISRVPPNAVRPNLLYPEDSLQQHIGRSSTDQRQQTSTQHLYMRGIPMDAFPSMDDLENQKLRSSIVIFNLGLVLQLRAKRYRSPEGGANQSNYIQLQKAQSLYQKSLFLLLDQPNLHLLRRCTGNFIIDLLFMACTNNLAEASFELGDNSRACKLFRQLRKFSGAVMEGVTNSKSTKGDQNVAQTVNDDDVIFGYAYKFLQNSLVPGMYTPPATARAA